MRIENFKSFLRLRIDKDGGLSIFPIGLRSVPDTDDGTLAETLIEPPIEVAP